MYGTDTPKPFNYFCMVYFDFCCLLEEEEKTNQSIIRNGTHEQTKSAKNSSAESCQALDVDFQKRDIGKDNYYPYLDLETFSLLLTAENFIFMR